MQNVSHSPLLRTWSREWLPVSLGRPPVNRLTTLQPSGHHSDGLYLWELPGPNRWTPSSGTAHEPASVASPVSLPDAWIHPVLGSCLTRCGSWDASCLSFLFLSATPLCCHVPLLLVFPGNWSLELNGFLLFLFVLKLMFRWCTSIRRYIMFMDSINQPLSWFINLLLLGLQNSYLLFYSLSFYLHLLLAGKHLKGPTFTHQLFD